MSDAATREQTNTEAGTLEPGLRVPFSVDEVGRATRSRGRLAKLIAAKLALDLIFVCALAFYTHAVTFGHAFDGDIERADANGVSGWVVDLERPDATVEVQLFLDGRFAATAVADGPSTNMQDRRAFVFRFEQPRYGEHEARVYGVREGRGGARRTLQQIGGPRVFNFK
ncbi:MAG TPA: hypothetical protein VF297_22495 [Pyrinomonadaceae bacterium]